MCCCRFDFFPFRDNGIIEGLVGKMGNMLPMLLLVAVAAGYDLHAGRIPNALLVASLPWGLGLAFASAGTAGLLMGLAGFVTGFLLILPGYLLRFTGAGDLKLLATLGLFCGPGAILSIFALSAVAGAVFIALRFVWRTGVSEGVGHTLGFAQTLLLSGQFRVLFSGVGLALKHRLPMAPFYALGSVLFFIMQKV